MRAIWRLESIFVALHGCTHVFTGRFTNGHCREAHPPRSAEDVHAGVAHIDEDWLLVTARRRAEESTLHVFPRVISLPHGQLALSVPICPLEQRQSHVTG